MSSTHSENLSGIYKSLTELSIYELDEIMSRILVLRRQKNKTVLPEAETELMRKINAVVPSAIQKRYNSLIKKKVKEKITDTELDELIEITEYMEARTNKRLEYLIELAKLKNMRLDELLISMQIKPSYYVA